MMLKTHIAACVLSFALLSTAFPQQKQQAENEDEIELLEDVEGEDGESGLPVKKRAFHVQPTFISGFAPPNGGWVPSNAYPAPHPPKPLFIPGSHDVHHHHPHHHPHHHHHHVHHPKPGKPVLVTPVSVHVPGGGHYQPTPAPQPPLLQPAVPHPKPSPGYRPGKKDDDDQASTGGKNPLGPRDYFPPPNIIGLLEDEEAITFLHLLEQADLLETLEEEGPFTVFVPTNEAFTKLDDRSIRALTNDDVLLRSVLQYHIVPNGKMYTKVIKDDLEADTLLEKPNDEERGAPFRDAEEEDYDDDESDKAPRERVRFNVYENGIMTINGAELNPDRVNQRAANGIVHFLDDVIYPLPAESLLQILNDDRRFTTLVRALEIADLSDVLDDQAEGPYTIFAPTDDAFDLIPREALNELLDDKDALTDLLRKHIVDGTKLSPALSFISLETDFGTKLRIRTKKGKVYVNDAQLIDGDLLATNGAVQIIDRVLL